MMNLLSEQSNVFTIQEFTLQMFCVYLSETGTINAKLFILLKLINVLIYLLHTQGKDSQLRETRALVWASLPHVGSAVESVLLM